MRKPVVYHIPICPFSQRLEILLKLKGQPGAVDFHVIDVTEPRPDWLLVKTNGVTALPALETHTGTVLRESLVLLRYLDESLGPRIAAPDPLEHAIENLLVSCERDFVRAGYDFVLNQRPELRAEHERRLLEQYAQLDALLLEHASGDTFLRSQFGWAEAVFAPIFLRFSFLDYYEGFDLPDEGRYARVRSWRAACLAHPAAQQVSAEQVIKLYYDYAHGVGNGELLPNRTRSSFSFEPDWRLRPWPVRTKYAGLATDRELGLL